MATTTGISSYLSRLDPQAQASLTGGSYTTSRGQTASYTQPTTKVQTQGFNQYNAVKDAFAGGANTLDAAAAGRGAAAYTMDPVMGTPVLGGTGSSIADLQSAGWEILEDEGVIRLGDRTVDIVTGQDVSGPGPAPVGDGGGPTGGTGPVVIDPEAPPTTPGAEADPLLSQLAGLTEAEIEATLAALEAEYGLTREQLLADRTQAGATYRNLLAQLERSRASALQGAESNALRRGIYRSGIYAEDVGEIERGAAEQQAAAAQEKQGRVNAIDQALARLTSQQEAAKAAEEARIRREALAAAGQRLL